MREIKKCLKCGKQTYCGDYCFDCFNTLEHSFNHEVGDNQAILSMNLFKDDKDE